MLTFEVMEHASGFAVTASGKTLMTPGRKPLVVPARALAGEIAAEWQVHQKYMSSQMKLTSLAYTAIDQMGNKEQLVEVLLAYIDTDTLCYRSSASEKLSAQQREQWDPVLAWAGKTFGGIWQTTSGVMPIEQSPDLHEAIRIYLGKQNAMRLAAACVMASIFSSVVLALAVLEKHTEGAGAFRLSRIEEEAQAEAWGRVDEAEERAAKMQAEIVTIKRFLSLLDKV